MKKRMISFVLLLCMLLTMLPPIGAEVAAADAADPATTGKNAPIDFATSTTQICPVCGGAAKEWQPLPQITSNTVLAAGHYYVPEGGISNTAQYNFDNNGNRCIHLNGNTLTSTTRIFNVTNNARIRMFGSGNVNANTGKKVVDGAVAYMATSRVYLYGGTYSVASGTPFYMSGTSGNMYIYDGVTITGGTVSNISVIKGKAYMYGGTVTGGKNTNGGNIYVTGGTFTMSGGTISNGTATTSGGNVYLGSNATFSMTGGTMTGGTATKYGGNIHAEQNTFTVSGTISSGTAAAGGNISIGEGSALTVKGTVAGGTVTGTAGSNWGGNIRAWHATVNIEDGALLYGGNGGGKPGSANIGCLGEDAGKTAVLNLNGGVVVGDIHTSSANGDFPGTTVKITGAPIVTKSYTVDGKTYTAKQGIYVHKDWTVDITDMTGGSVCLTGNNGQVVTSTHENAALLKGCLVAHSSSQQMDLVDGAFQLNVKQASAGSDFAPWDNDGKAVCPVCGEEKTWTAYSGTGTLGEQKDGAHIYLSGDRNATGYDQPLSVAENATACFNLNGYTLSMDGRIAITKAGTTLNVMDTTGTGVVTTTGTRTASNLYNYTVVNQNDGVINLYGGTFQNANANFAVVRCSVGSAEINIYDGAVIDGNGQTRGILQIAGKVNVCGGILKNGIGASAGGNIRTEGGTLTIKGGTIFGGKATHGGNIYAINATVSITDDDDAKTDAPQIMSGSATTGNGGNIALGDNAKMTMNAGTVTNGTAASGNGGNISVAGDSGKKAECTLHTGATVSNGTASKGGNLYAAYATINISGAQILGGVGSSSAGSVLVATHGTLNLMDGLIDGGSSKGNGGNLATSTISSRLNISGGTVSNGTTTNSGTGNGGGNIHANNGYLNITGGVISGGKAPNATGGNIFSRLGINNAVYNTDNHAIINDDGDPNTPKPLITGGTCKNTGGNLYIIGDRYSHKYAYFTLGDCEITNGDSANYAYGDDISLQYSGVLTILSTFAGEADFYLDTACRPAVMLGGKVDEATIITEGPFPGRLVFETHAAKYILIGKEGDTAAYICDTGIQKADGSYIWQTDNAQILAAAKENEGCKIFAAPGEMELDGGEYTIDLRGNNVHFTGTGTVNLVDTTNDTYQTYGTATAEAGVTINTGFVAEGAYYVLAEGETYSAHRISYDLSKVSLRPSASGIYFTGKWECDETLAKHIDTFGVAVSVKDVPEADFATDGHSKFSWFENSDFENGVEKTGVLIKGILKDTTANRVALNDKYGQMPIHAVAYVTIDGNTAVSAGMSYSLQDVLSLINESVNIYYENAPELQAFMTAWSDKGISGEDWEFDFTPSEDALLLNEAYGDRIAFHGEFHDHADTGGKSDGRITLSRAKEFMDARGIDFTTLLDHYQILHMELDDWDSSLFIGGSEFGTILHDSPATGKSLHVNMIFSDPENFKQLMAVHNPGGKYTGGKFGFGLDEASGNEYYEEHQWSVAEFKQLIADIKACGGMYVFPHPKDGSRYISDDPLDYWFADWVGLEVFYGPSYYAPTGERTVNAYKLWLDLLAAGKKVWATAGSDSHSAPNTNALTTIYSTEKNAVEHFEHGKQGDMTCGPVGIRMVMGDTLTGGETSFEGKRLSICVSDIHESAFFADHTYSVKVIAGKDGAEEVVYSGEFDPLKPFYYGLDADNSCDYYRVEVYDESDTRITTGMPTAIGNPIWNIK